MTTHRWEFCAEVIDCSSPGYTVQRETLAGENIGELGDQQSIRQSFPIQTL